MKFDSIYIDSSSTIRKLDRRRYMLLNREERLFNNLRHEYMYTTATRFEIAAKHGVSILKGKVNGW